MQKHDCGTISAYRSEYTHKENQQRNKLLLAKLYLKGYNIIDVLGSYIENFGSKNAVEVKKHTYFVIDTKNYNNLESDLKEFGELFEQDSIMFIPKNTNKGILIGTSHRETSYPKYNEKIIYPNAVWGKDNMFMTKVKGRPYSFNESSEITELYKPSGFFGMQGYASMAKSNSWKDIVIND